MNHEHKLAFVNIHAHIDANMTCYQLCYIKYSVSLCLKIIILSIICCSSIWNIYNGLRKIWLSTTTSKIHKLWFRNSEIFREQCFVFFFFFLCQLMLLSTLWRYIWIKKQERKQNFKSANFGTNKENIKRLDKIGNVTKYEQTWLQYVTQTRVSHNIIH